MSESDAAVNTDREIWREREGDFYADSLFVTAGGGIGINCGGAVIVKPVREWFHAARKAAWLKTGLEQVARADAMNVSKVFRDIARNALAAAAAYELTQTDPAVKSHEALIEALKFYMAICGNTAYSVDRQNASQAYDMGSAALALAAGEKG